MNNRSITTAGKRLDFDAVQKLRARLQQTDSLVIALKETKADTFLLKSDKEFYREECDQAKVDIFDKDKEILELKNYVSLLHG